MITRQQALELIRDNPAEIGHWVGFKDLTELHNQWLKKFLFSKNDITLQGHRGSYKTTTLSLFFAIHAVIFPNTTIMFFRKTGAHEVILQTGNILQTGCIKEIVRALYGKDIRLLKASSFAIETNLRTSVSGANQITGRGLFGSITGLHADIVVTDDIVNVQDRISAAEREHTKTVFQELQNIKNRGGRFINTGTPWHKDDAFTLMPDPLKYDCYSTGLMTKEQIEDMRKHMSPSLFAANYELKHISSEDVIFTEPEMGADESTVMNGLAHLDSAFYGEDYTAFTIMAYHDGKYYVYGRMWRKHVEDCYPQILDLYNHFLCDKLYNEKNADKGMVARDLKLMGIRTATYDEHMNKHIKIVTYLKAIWPEVVFVNGTDPEYIEQITDYNENASHDDAPDSAACLARLLYRKHSRRKDGAGDIDYVSGSTGSWFGRGATGRIYTKSDR